MFKLCFDCWNFFKGMLKCKWIFVILSGACWNNQRAFILFFLKLELRYVSLRFKVDSLLLWCRKKWHTSFSPALWAETPGTLLQWLQKVMWQCQRPRRCNWADLSCLWCPHISFLSPLPFIIRCPKSVIYNTLFQSTLIYLLQISRSLCACIAPHGGVRPVRWGEERPPQNATWLMSNVTFIWLGKAID